MKKNRKVLTTVFFYLKNGEDKMKKGEKEGDKAMHRGVVCQ